MKKILIAIIFAANFGALAQTPISQLPTTAGFGQYDAIVNYVQQDSSGHRQAYAEQITNLFGIGINESNIIVSASDTSAINGNYYLQSGTLPIHFGGGSSIWVWTNYSTGYSVEFAAADNVDAWELNDGGTTVCTAGGGRGLSPNVTWTNVSGSGIAPVVRFAQFSNFGAGGNAANWLMQGLPSSYISFSDPLILDDLQTANLSSSYIESTASITADGDFETWGDAHVDGKLYATGGVDPPYVNLEPHSRGVVKWIILNEITNQLNQIAAETNTNNLCAENFSLHSMQCGANDCALTDVISNRVICAYYVANDDAFYNMDNILISTNDAEKVFTHPKLARSH